MSLEKDTKGPAVKLPPPLLFLSFILLAGLAHYWWPLSLSNGIGVKIVAVTFILAGLVSVLMIKLSFDKVNTEIEPWKPTSVIVSDGFFAYSRNPIYLALCVITVGVGLYLDSVWVMLSFLPAAVAVYFVAIKKEEAYLEQKFGEDYLKYKQNVRRWI